MWLILLFSLFSPAFACDDPEALVAKVETAVGEARLELAQETLKRLEVSFGCSPVVDASLLARMWLAEGVLAYFNGDVESTKLSFGAARGVAPNVWDENYGADLRSIYDGVVVEQIKGEIRLASPAEGYVISVDGVQTELPISVSPGLHLVQIGSSPVASSFGQIVYVMPEDSLVLDPQLEALVVVSEVSKPSTDRPPAKNRTFLITGAAVFGAGLGMAGLALAQQPAIDEAQLAKNEAALRKASVPQQIYGTAAYALMGVGSVGVVIHFVPKGR